MKQVGTNSIVSRDITPKVVLVHGTFASDPRDDGSKWWQRGSDFSNQLQSDLRGEATLVSDRELFRWLEDTNSEIHRFKAAVRLLQYLDGFERSGTPYHLIGHSHGGSVIWEALKLSYRGQARSMFGRSRKMDVPLKYLLSWTTIGTPFIHRRLKWSSWITAGGFTVLALLTLGAAIFFGAFWAFVWGSDTPFLKRIVDFIPYLLSGWFVYVGLSGFVTSYDDGRALRKESVLADLVMAGYGDKWYGIWSPDDEAINSLQGAIGLRLHFFADRPLERSPFVGRLWWALVFPAAWMSQVFLRLTRPIVDRFISELLKRKTLGDERPAPKNFSVSPAPFLISLDGLALNEVAAARLQAKSNKALGENAPLLRRLLREIAVSPGSTFSEHAAHMGVPDSMLIHTSYFHSSDVRHLVLANIALSQPSDLIASTLPLKSLEEVRRLKNRVRQVLAEHIYWQPNLFDRALIATPTWVVVLVGSITGMALAWHLANDMVTAIISGLASAISAYPLTPR